MTLWYMIIHSNIEHLLERIRHNCVLMSDYHKKRYLHLREHLKVYKIPIIVLSSANSIISVGLQPYVDQGLISALVSLVSLFVGILGSIELYMKIQENMEIELVAQRNFYLLSIEIYKVLQLDEENRNCDMKLFLEEKFAHYSKLIENSNVVAKKIKDKLTNVELNDSITQTTHSTPLSQSTLSISNDQF